MSHLQNTLPHSSIMESWRWKASSGDSQQGELVVAALIMVLILVLRLLLKSANKKLPPGPRGLPIVGYLPFLTTQLHESFTELAGVYGPVYKLWLGCKMYVVIGSPSLVKQVREQVVTFADRDPLIASKIISYGGNDIAFCSYGPDWRKLRKVFARELLCSARLESSYVLRKREVEKAVKDVYQKRGKALDFGQLVFITVSNTVLRMLLGCPVCGEEGVMFFLKIRKLVDEFNVLQSTPNISDLIPALARIDIQGIERKSRKAQQSFDRILSSLINERRKLASVRGCEVRETKDFLQILLDLNSNGDAASSITDDQLKGILVDTIIGGTDTSATTIEWTMAMLMQHPDAMRKIYEELDEVVRRSSIVEELHLPRLHYLDAVVKETLRLHPAVPMLAMRCPSQDCKLSEYTIPKGITVIINAYAIHRDPQLWASPLEFIPERFLDENAAAKFDYLGNSSQYFPFGTGRRVCAGLPMAEKMVKYILASLLHSFEWRLAHGTEVDLTDKFGIVLKLEKPLILVPLPKLANSDLY